MIATGVGGVYSYLSSAATDLTTGSTFHGPVSTTDKVTRAVYLPLITK